MSSLILVSNAFDPNQHSKFKEFIVQQKKKPFQKCMIANRSKKLLYPNAPSQIKNVKQKYQKNDLENEVRR